MTGRRGLLAAVAGCLVAAAAMLLGSGQNWLQATLEAQPPLPSRSQTFTGADVVDSLVPVGILVAAAALALIASRWIGRLIVGGVLVLAGLLTLATAGRFLYDGGTEFAYSWAQDYATAGGSLFPTVDANAAPAVLALAGAGIALAAGLFTLTASRRWAVMGKRYDRQGRSAAGHPGGQGRPRDAASAVQPDPRSHGSSSAPPVSETAMWAALDRGEDPTAGSAEPQPSHAPTPDQPPRGR